MMAIAVLFTSCRIKTIEEKGPKVTKEIDQKDFDKIQVSGSAEIVFEQDSVYSIKVSATEKDMERLCISLINNSLDISYKKDSKMSIGESPNYKLHITAPDLKGLYVYGACDFDAKDINTDSLDISIRGAADINIEKLTAEKINIDIRGAGDVKAYLKDCGDVDVNIKGTGAVKLTGNAHNITKHIAGVGDVNTKHLTLTK